MLGNYEFHIVVECGLSDKGYFWQRATGAYRDGPATEFLRFSSDEKIKTGCKGDVRDRP